MRRLPLFLLLAVIPAVGQNLSTSGNIATGGPACGGANCVYYQLPPATPWVVTTIAGTWSGTINIALVSAANANYGNLNSVPWQTVTSTTVNGNWSVASAGATFVLVQASALASGTAQVSMASSQTGAPLNNPVFPGNAYASAFCTSAGCFAGAIPAGSTGQLQLNGGGTFAASPNLYYLAADGLNGQGLALGLTPNPITHDHIGDSWSVDSANNCTAGVNCWMDLQVAQAGGIQGTNIAQNGSPYSRSVAMYGNVAGPPQTPALAWSPYSDVTVVLGQNDDNRFASYYISCIGTAVGDHISINGSTNVAIVSSGATGAYQSNVGGTDVQTCANLNSVLHPCGAWAGTPFASVWNPSSLFYSGSAPSSCSPTGFTQGTIGWGGSADANIVQNLYSTQNDNPSQAVIRVQPGTPGGAMTITGTGGFTINSTFATPTQQTQAIKEQAEAILAFQLMETAAQSNAGIATLGYAQNMTLSGGGGCTATNAVGNGMAEQCNSLTTLTTPQAVPGSEFYVDYVVGTGLSGNFTVTANDCTGTPRTSATFQTAIVGYEPGYTSIGLARVANPCGSGATIYTINPGAGTTIFMNWGSNGNATGTPDQRMAQLTETVPVPNVTNAVVQATIAGEDLAVQELAFLDQMPVVIKPIGRSMSCAQNTNLCNGLVAVGFQHLSLAAQQTFANYLLGQAGLVQAQTEQAGLNGPYLTSSAATVANATNAATTSTSANASFFPVFVPSSANGNQGLNLNAAFTYNPSTGNLAGTTNVNFQINGTPLFTVASNTLCGGTASCGNNTPPTGGTNTGLGISALQSLSNGISNTAMGASACANISTTSLNTCIGKQAGAFFGGVLAFGGAQGNNTGAANGTYLGYGCSALTSGSSFETCIGAQGLGHGSQTATVGSMGNVGTYLVGTAFLSNTVLYGNATSMPLATPTSPNAQVAYSTAGNVVNAALADSTSYCYRIAASNTNSCALTASTLASTEACLTTGVGANQNTLTSTWGRVDGAAEYCIYGRTTGAEKFIANLGAGSLQFVDTGVQAPAGSDGIFSGTYTSGLSPTGATGTTCNLASFNNSNSGGTATVKLTSLNTIASGTALTITAAGTGSASAATSATGSNGTATNCAGTATVATTLGITLPASNTTLPGISTGKMTASLAVSGASYGTSANCSSGASPAVCASSVAGGAAMPTNAASSSIVVQTTAVTANSQIFVTADDTLGTKLSVTCNTTAATLAGGLAITARTAGTSFTVSNNVAVSTNPLCISWFIVN